MLEQMQEKIEDETDMEMKKSEIFPASVFE